MWLTKGLTSVSPSMVTVTAFSAIDDRGSFVSGDFMTALMGQYLLERYPGSKIMYDARGSWAVPDLITAAGGTALMERVGHAFYESPNGERGCYFRR